MRYRWVFFVCLLFAVLGWGTRADALSLASLKAGVGYIPDGSVFGGMAKASLGPFGAFFEFFKKGDTTTINTGGDIFQLSLPLPKLQPYVALGGGISRKKSGDESRTRLLANAAAGATLKTTGASGLFAQVKYMYTFGATELAVREVAIQAGLSFNLGL